MRTVLHVDTERGWRGGERQVLWLAQRLAEHGVRSLIAARPREPLAHRASASGIEVVPCSPLFEADPFAARHLRRALARVGADIVHAHTGHSVMLAALATRRTSTPMVVTRRVSRPLRRGALTRWKYGRAAATIAISRAVAHTLQDAGLSEQRVTVVPSGIDLGALPRPVAPETLRALGVPPGAMLVVTVAALTAEKDHLTLLAALASAHARVPSLHALLVGRGPLDAQLRARARELGLAHAVTFTGHRDDAGSLLAAADVAALASRSEGLSTMLIEAMALGVPIVATNVGGIPEVVAEPSVADGRDDSPAGILVAAGDAPALGDAIVQVAADATLRARLSRAGVRRAARFSIDRTAAETLAVYERVLARGSR